MKIFISAYACEPEKGSEPGIGWNVVNELAAYHEVHVLTRANNRESIEKALEGRKNVPVFHYYDLPKWISFWKNKRRGYHLYYYLWQYGAFSRYRKFVNSSGFDIVQHLTFANVSMPSLFMFCKPMTVWGPIGKTSIPKAVFQALSLKIKIKECLRKMSMVMMSLLDPARLLTPHRADFILESGMPPGVTLFPDCFRKKILQHPQTGINTSEPEYQITRSRKPDGRVRLLICSEFIHWKGVTFAAELYGRIAQKRTDVELHVYGSGPEKGTMKQIFRKYGVENSVTWKGFVSKTEMMQALFDGDILLYPCYHHGLATVILQAMFARLPIVTIAGDPVAVTVAEAGGIVADGKNMDEIYRDLENKVIELIEHPELRKQTGDSERRTVTEHYEWRILCRKLSDLLISMKR